MRRSAALAVLLALPAFASADPLYLAAQCAAFWLGRDDVARRSRLLDADPTDPARAAAFRAVALRLNSGAAGPVDHHIARERPAMDRLVRAAIAGDPVSLDLHDRLLETCDAFAATQAETRGLR
ncbi:MAG: hypothetical protein ACT4OK_04105 [Gemmobacter sp.]